MALGLLASPPGFAQELFVYPAEGQTPDQQAADEAECRGFARNQTGFDPNAPVSVARSSSPPPGTGSNAVRGAAVGATVGAIASGGSTKRTKRAAAAGAAGGALIGGMQRRDAQMREEQLRQQEQQQYAQALGNYNRAYTACLEGKGYTVR
jgi:hypothetical protein